MTGDREHRDPGPGPKDPRGGGRETDAAGAGRGRGGRGLTRTCGRRFGRAALRRRKRGRAQAQRRGGRVGRAREAIPESGRRGARVSAELYLRAQVPGQGPRRPWLAHNQGDRAMGHPLLRSARLMINTGLCVRHMCVCSSRVTCTLAFRTNMSMCMPVGTSSLRVRTPMSHGHSTLRGMCAHEYRLCGQITFRSTVPYSGAYISVRACTLRETLMPIS